MATPRSFARLAALVVLLTAARAGAQTQTGAIQGRVLDAGTGAPLEGVVVVVSSPALQGTQGETTDAEGFYLVANLPPGVYEVAFFYGAATVRQPGVRVAVGGTTPVHLRLDADAGAEAITIRQRAPAIDAGSTKQGARLDRAWIDHVPQDGRGYEGTLGAAAGAQDDLFGVSFSGSTSVENSYVVDGVNTTGLSYGTLGSPLLTNFIEEIEIITGGYDAELGRATGGVVNVVTRSGSNQLRGSVWGNFTSGALQRPGARPFVAGSAIAEENDLRYAADFGFELGGPIVRDRLWFYVGVAPLVTSQRVSRVIATQVDRRVDGHDYAADPDADDDPATTTAPGCEATGTCEGDGVPDLDLATGAPAFEEVDRSSFLVDTTSVQFTAKLTFAFGPEHQGAVALTGSTASGVDVVSLDGTPTGTRLSTSSLVTDGSLRWVSKLAGSRTELTATLGWHRSHAEATPISAVLPESPGVATMETPAVEVQSTDLGSVGRNPDQRESARALAACTDGDPAVFDPFPGIQNCPVVAYRYGAPGGLDDRTEQRYALKVGLTQRVRFLGHHQLKVGFDGEDNRLASLRRFTGGRMFTGYDDHWEVLQYVRVHEGGGDVCGFDAETGEPRACDVLDVLPVHGETLSWAVFVQDKWDLLPNLRLSLGVRFEEQALRWAEEVRGTVDPLTGATLGDDALSLAHLWAPRVGLVWDPSEEGRSKLYASYGRFYESIPMDINDRAFGGEVDYLVAWDWSTQCGAPTGGDDRTPRLPSDPGSCPRSPSAAAPPMWDALFGGASTLVMPGLKAQRMDELVLGGELEVVPDVTVGLAYQHRGMGQVIEDVSVDGTATYIIANPGELDEDAEADVVAALDAMPDGPEKEALAERLEMFRKVRTFDRPRRDYDGVTFTVRRRFTGRWFVEGAYTYSRLAGNYPGLFSDDNGQLDPNITSQYDLIELLANREGRLPADRPHIVKLAGFYRFDLAGAGVVTTGATVHAQSGRPVGLLGSHALYGQHEVFILPRGAGGRSDFTTRVDLRVGWARKLGRTTEIAVTLDLFNVLDASGVTAVDQVYTLDNVNPIVGGGEEDLKHLKRQTSDGSETGDPARKQRNWGRAAAYQDPLTARIGVTLSF
jgi:hypothetical protein